MSIQYLFRRQWGLTLLPRGAKVASVYKSSPDSGQPLEIQFDIKRTLHSTSNKATFRLYNLSIPQRTSFDVGTRIIFDCGYGDNWSDYASRIYLGDVMKRTIKQEGGDVVLELECADSELVLQQCFVKAQYSSPTSLARIVQNLCKQLHVQLAGQVYGFDKATVQRLPKITIERFSQLGPARMVLDALLKPRDIEWSFQNGQLLLQASKGIIKVLATNLSKDTGLLDRPTLSAEGMTCRALIQASIAPGAAVRLITSEANVSGNYRVVEAQYKGDTLGGDWAVEVMGEPLGNLLAAYTSHTSQTSFEDAQNPDAAEADMEGAL